jgi:hypothetical protein
MAIVARCYRCQLLHTRMCGQERALQHTVLCAGFSYMCVHTCVASQVHGHIAVAQGDTGGRGPGHPAPKVPHLQEVVPQVRAAALRVRVRAAGGGSAARVLLRTAP